MNWLLDTNVCIRYLNGRSDALRVKLNSVDPDQIYLCSVVKAELFFGAARSNQPDKTRMNQSHFLSMFDSLPFDDNAADAYGRIRSDLSQKGMLIGPNDLMIASICVANSLTIITRNVKEFSRVVGLQVEDWETDQTE